MTIVPVLKLAADLFVEVLSDSTNGFNPALADACAQYGIDPFLVDFADESKNFWRSAFEIGDLYDNESTELPGMALYEAGDLNNNFVTSNVFAGPMHFQDDVHLIWKAEGAAKFERMRYAVHDAMINLFNGDFAQSIFQPSQITYNGGIGMLARGRMQWVKEDGFWLQTVSHRIEVTAHVF